MRNRVFSGRMFTQGVRLLRLPGIILGACALVLTALQTFVTLQSLIRNSERLDTVLTSAGYLYYTVPVGISLFASFAPLIFVLCAFSFLRKRRGSDFYHSIPVNRICLFSSYALAAVAWTAAIVLLLSAFNFIFNMIA